MVLPECFSGCLTDEPSGYDVETAKTLTWTEPIQINKVASHYIVYQSTCTIFDGSTSTEVDSCALNLLNDSYKTQTNEVIVSEKPSAPNSNVLPELCSLESSVLCVSCAVVCPNSTALRTSSPSFCTQSDAGFWQCIGLTPLNCFRVPAPIKTQTSLAVLLVPLTNHVARLIAVETDAESRSDINLSRQKMNLN